MKHSGLHNIQQHHNMQIQKPYFCTLIRVFHKLSVTQNDNIANFVLAVPLERYWTKCSDIKFTDM